MNHFIWALLGILTASWVAWAEPSHWSATKMISGLTNRQERSQESFDQDLAFLKDQLEKTRKNLSDEDIEELSQQAKRLLKAQNLIKDRVDKLQKDSEIGIQQRLKANELSKMYGERIEKLNQLIKDISNY